MRFIDPHQVTIEGWNVKANKEAAKLNAGTPIAQCNPIWQDAKNKLKQISYEKCWYCESKEIRSDGAVDHFRPKALYPWLAFELTNFRFACTFCNCIRKNPDTGQSLGKGDHFPLFAGNKAADHSQLINESPLLLDPCKGADILLLDFDTDGKACAKQVSSDINRRRAEESIDHYHLNHPSIVEVRRRISLELKEWIDAADLIFQDDDEDDQVRKFAFSKYVECIARSITERAEFSVFARRFVAAYSTKPWVDDILNSF